jgi:hypothetical protein
VRVLARVSLFPASGFEEGADDCCEAGRRGLKRWAAGRSQRGRMPYLVAR